MMHSTATPPIGEHVDAVWPVEHSGLGFEIPYKAWVPAPISQIVPRFSDATLDGLTAAEKAMRLFFDGRVGSDLGWFLRVAEASASSMIEDLWPSPQAVARAQFSGVGCADDVAVLGNADATAEAAAAGASGKLTVEAVQRIHAVLVESLPSYRWAPGEFRDRQNWVGAGLPPPSEEQSGPANPTVAYVPPPPDRVDGLMKDLIEFCNRDDIPPVAHAAMAHARFEEIHPFPDGNGRTGRAVVHAIWARHGLASPDIIVPFSVALQRRIGPYIFSLVEFRVPDSARQAEAAAAAVRLFSDAAVDAVCLVERFAERLHRLLEDCADELTASRRSTTGRALASLAEQPVTDSVTLAEQLGVSERQAKRALDRMMGAGAIQRCDAGPGVAALEAGLLIDAFEDVFNLPWHKPRTLTNWEETAWRAIAPVYFGADAYMRLPPVADEWTGAVDYARPWISDSSPRRCGEMMPQAQKRCVLKRGHSGAHRSVKPWQR